MANMIHMAEAVELAKAISTKNSKFEINKTLGEHFSPGCDLLFKEVKAILKANNYEADNFSANMGGVGGFTERA
jgi:hypothetical protein